jgi:hypothetical protein
MNFASLPNARAAALSILLAWLAPRVARAEDAVRYKFQDYQESGGRIAVEVHSAAVEKDFGTSTHLKVEGVIDAIAGATPNGQPAPAGSDQVPLSTLDEKRKAWTAVLSRQFPRVNLALGVANSRESDYVSNGWSVNTLTDFNQKNTTLLAGVAGTLDDIKVFYQTGRARKQTNDVIVGVTQLVDPQTSVSFNVTWGRQRGYLSDPYKLVQRSVEIFPGVSLPLTFAENRPVERDKYIALLAVNRAYREIRGAVDLSYRFYHDTYDTDSHTFDFGWFQEIGERLVVRPGVRYYTQSAAYFYHYRLDGTPIVPVAGPPRRNGPFYSSDYRLSEMQTFTYGMKVVWNLNDRLQFDAAYERYDMRGTDHVTPQSAYCRANIVTLGAKFSW